MVKKKIKKGEITRSIFEFLLDLGSLVPRPFETPYAWIRRAGSPIPLRAYSRAVHRLKKRGMLEIIKKQNKQFLRLTSRGQIKALLAMARTPKVGAWDGKWRLVTFDIPEQFKNQRDFLRSMLKKQGFKKLQASVFIGPHPINRPAVEYLKTSGLINYIRIFRVDEADSDKALLQLFHLKR